MLRQPVKQRLPKHLVFPKGVSQVLLRLVQSHQNHYFYLFKVSKMTIFNYNLFKVSKMTVFNYDLFKVSDSSVKWSSPANFLKVRFAIFRFQKYVKKGT